MKISKHLLMLAVAIIGGLGAAVTSAVAAGDDLVILCYRDRTVQVPSYLVARYIFKGATSGACPVTGP